MSARVSLLFRQDLRTCNGDGSVLFALPCKFRLNVRVLVRDTHSTQLGYMCEAACHQQVTTVAMPVLNLAKQALKPGSPSLVLCLMDGYIFASPGGNLRGCSQADHVQHGAAGFGEAGVLVACKCHNSHGQRCS